MIIKSIKTLKLLNYLSLFFISSAFGFTVTWSEGKCDPSKNIYEGATRDFYNRAARLPWDNLAGDWLDENLIEQGNQPFDLLTQRANLNPSLFSADVTSLVQKWLSGQVKNNGFLLKAVNTNALTFYSKDSTIIIKHPMLVLKYVDGSSDFVNAKQDTILSMNTYICSGTAEELFGSKNILLYFELMTNHKKLRQAKLILYSKNIVSSPSPIPVFAVTPRIPKSISNSDVIRLNMKSDHYYIEKFDTDNWEQYWEIQNSGTHEIISKAVQEDFTPINGNALKISIPEGEHFGLSAFFIIDQEKFPSKHAYFHYNLKFSPDWYSNVGGKLPGFTGSYMNKSYRGGWGGRASTGDNGWSARGLFGGSTSNENLFPNHIPIGSYLYHSNIKKTYGSGEYWNLHPNGMLQTNRWYSIEQSIKFNTKFQSDGELKAWINGQLVYEETGINFSNHPKVGIEGVWINIYHGGKKKASKDLNLYIDNVIISNNRIGTNITK